MKPPSGCHFRTRCQVFRDILDDTQRQKCMTDYPELIDRGSGHPTACHYAEVRVSLSRRRRRPVLRSGGRHMYPSRVGYITTRRHLGERAVAYTSPRLR